MPQLVPALLQLLSLTGGTGRKRHLASCTKLTPYREQKSANMLLEKPPKVPHNNPGSLPGRISAEKVGSTFYYVAVLLKGGNGEIIIKVIIEQFFAPWLFNGQEFSG